MTARRTLSDKTLQARAQAKFLGGMALQGSRKQKTWGEEIRAKKLATATPEQAELLVNPLSLARWAHFWIENRDKTTAQLAEFIRRTGELNAQADALQDAGEVDRYREICAEYNALTTKWGFRK